ncbi:TetR/AcrR family transcriptional regulator [Streptomyces morookaense]|uniref:TetR/AcrR family transcriptional regulator n=1 Tax=Streptomyces morookaense TaxID=1970 RepID=A0A7Y7EAJ6_STRMO|nr:TetR/AcrR family transcriptional regulator [Streptomyces morookaense]NVK82185.1 TetR/AcrR family transcriptional regulator [Streptomyces morookaense]GHF46298.1 TetR family transcriptional regulator [Streptomyces morookaense]
MTASPAIPAPQTSPRERILQAAARLLAASGGAPVSTRAVCEAAGVGAPTLYHHFGDKQGLFDAVVAHGFEQYLAGKKAAGSTGDPVEDLRRGWDAHVEFGRTHPAFYALMYGTPRPGPPPAAAREAHGALLELCRRIALAGRLRTAPELAAQMVLAANTGVTLSLIADPDRDGDQLSRRTRDAIIDAVTTPETGTATGAGPSDAGPHSAAATLAASLAHRDAPGLTANETLLLRDWLRRITDKEA